MRVAIIRKFDTGDSGYAWRILVVLVLTTIVIHSWAWDNSPLARDTLFSNTTRTRRFQRERDSGSTQPIFRIKADSVREKVHLSFAARRFLKRSVNFQKFSFENELHTKKDRFYCIFKFKGIMLTLIQSSSLQAQFAGTSFIFKKPRVGFYDLAFGKRESKFYQRNLTNLSPFFSYCELFLASQHSILPLRWLWIINDVPAFCAMK